MIDSTLSAVNEHVHAFLIVFEGVISSQQSVSGNIDPPLSREGKLRSFAAAPNECGAG